MLKDMSTMLATWAHSLSLKRTDHEAHAGLDRAWLGRPTRRWLPPYDQDSLSFRRSAIPFALTRIVASGTASTMATRQSDFADVDPGRIALGAILADFVRAQVKELKKRQSPEPGRAARKSVAYP
ncbi:hypothetical protein [Micromonospora sp. NPDC023814]|uniref:hypothetical protein n=1 Tax=Micromonospora sp. NPDC023814 TaxID=3154596 RepID=UPI0033E33697